MKLKAYKLKQNNIEDTSDIDSYLKLPKKDRLLWGVFYVYPKYLRFESVEDFYKDGKFENAFDKHFRKKYPVQFFIRDTVPDFLRTICYPICLWSEKIKNFVFPRQRWLYRKIPNHWIPSTNVIMISIFESMVHYVENENWFKHVDWEFDEEHRETKKKIDQIYRWSKIRMRLDRKLNKEFSIHWGLYQKILDSGDKHFATMAIEISDKLY